MSHSDSLKIANRVRKEKFEVEKSFVYHTIIDYPGKSIYFLAELIDFTIGKVQRAVNALKKEKMVKVTKEIINGRAVSVITAVSAEEMIDWTVPEGLPDE